MLDREVRSLTGIRGVAAIYVVTFHFFLGIGTRGLISRFITHGYLSVDLFFVLSGFVMAMSYGKLMSSGFTWRNYGHFLGKRIARIYPLYFAACLPAAVLVGLGLLEFKKNAPYTVSLVADILLLQNWVGLPSMNPATWSLSTEWAAYLAFPLLVATTVWRLPQARYIIPVVCLFFVALAMYGHVGRVYGPFDLPNAFSTMTRCLSEFTLGICSFYFTERSNDRFSRNAPRVATITCLALLLSLLVLRAELFTVMLYPVLLASLFLGRGGVSRFLSSSPIHRAGELSYSLYLIHPLLYPLIAAVHHAANRHGIAHGQAIGSVCAVPVLCACVPLSYRYIETPGRRLLRRWLGEGQPAAPPNAMA